MPRLEPFSLPLPISFISPSTFWLTHSVSVLPPKVYLSVEPNPSPGRISVPLTRRVHFVRRDHPIEQIVVGAHHHDIILSHTWSRSVDIKFVTRSERSSKFAFT